ncbi:hypothetical protein BH23GEM11_BH23GEM11_08770 [soil metagenome]
MMRRGMRRGLFASLLALTAAGCSGDSSAAQAEPERTPLQVVFVYDRSTSITPEELGMYQQLTGRKLSQLSHGDRVAAIELLQLSLDESPTRWAQRVPDREFQNRAMQRDSVTLARFIQDARDYLRQYTEPERQGDYLGTDILSTLHDVAEDVRAHADHRTTVVLFSDMLQATEEMNMEGLIRMPPPDWVQARAAEGRLPDFSGACIVVVGARTDTAAGQRVKAFWEEYFAATGGTLLERNYAYRPVEIPGNPCPGQG